MTGEVEMDETYVGGKPRQSDKAKWQGKSLTEVRKAAKEFAVESRTPVFGMVERDGSVRATVVPSAQMDTLMPHVLQREARIEVYTDEAHGLPTSSPRSALTTRRSTTQRRSTWTGTSTRRPSKGSGRW